MVNNKLIPENLPVATVIDQFEKEPTIHVNDKSSSTLHIDYMKI